MAIETRDVGAIGFAALTGALCSAALSTAYFVVFFRLDPGLFGLVMMLMGALVACAVVSSFSAFIFGLAWHALALRNGWSAWWGYGFAGAVLGAGMGAFVGEWYRSSFMPAADLPFHLITMLAIGAITGVAMAITVWRMRRPDLDRHPERVF